MGKDEFVMSVEQLDGWTLEVRDTGTTYRAVVRRGDREEFNRAGFGSPQVAYLAALEYVCLGGSGIRIKGR